MKERNHSNVKFVIHTSPLKALLRHTYPQFMKERGHSNVKFVVILFKTKVSLMTTLHLFMRGKILSNVDFVMLAFQKDNPLNITFLQFMKKETIRSSATVCDNTFADKQTLNCHILVVHDRNKPSKCNICDTRFALNKAKKHFSSVLT